MRRSLLLIAPALLGCSGGALWSDGGANDAKNDAGLDRTTDGGDPTLTCEWLASPSNCWTTTALTAATCLPSSADTGLLNANNSICTYATGEVVTFTPAIVLPPPSDISWNFSVAGADGRPCLHYQDTGSALTLVVGNQTVSETLYGDLGIRITCPDGTSVENANAFDLLNCPNFIEVLPGIGWSSADTFVTTTLTGTGSTSLVLFSCTKS